MRGSGRTSESDWISKEKPAGPAQVSESYRMLDGNFLLPCLREVCLCWDGVTVEPLVMFIDWSFCH